MYPHILYEDSYISLDDISAPVFPNNSGLELHTNANDKPEYTTTSRLHGTTQLSWVTKDVLKPDRDDIFDYWTNSLDYGAKSVTIVDHLGRMLFDCSLNEWRETWSAKRGGIYNIKYDFESGVPWTHPCHAAYTMIRYNLNSHNRNGNDLLLRDGNYIWYDSDNKVLRRNGNALYTTDSATVPVIGTASSLNIKKNFKYNSTSIFCQIMIDDTDTVSYKTSVKDFVQIVYDGGSLSLRGNDSTGTGINIYGYIVNGLETGEIKRTSSSYNMIDYKKWYDVAIVFDMVNGKGYIYVAESGTESGLTEYMEGETVIENSFGRYNSNANAVIPDENIKDIVLLTDVTYNTGETLKKNYIQNVFVFDGFLSTYQFNTMRNLCHMWNQKTDEIYPK